MENLNIIHSKIQIVLQLALLGKIYPAIRRIVYKYESDKKKFTLRFYLDRNPTEEDYKNVSIVMQEFISNFPNTAFDELSEECMYLEAAKLDALDVIAVYARKEY